MAANDDMTLSDDTFTLETYRGRPCLVLADGRRFAIPAGGEGEDDQPGDKPEDEDAERAEGDTGEADDAEEREAAGADTEVDDDESDPEKLKHAVKSLKKRIGKLSRQRGRTRDENTDLAARLAKAEAQLQRYAQTEQALEREEQERTQRTPDARKRAARQAALRELLDDTYGPGTSERLERQRENEELQVRAYAEQGLGVLKAELEAHKIKVDKANLARWDRAISAEMQADPDLIEQFWNPQTQADAVVAAFERVRDGLVNPAVEANGGPRVARIARQREAVLGSPRGESPDVDVKPITPPKDVQSDPTKLANFWREQMRQHMARGDDATT